MHATKKIGKSLEYILCFPLSLLAHRKKMTQCFAWVGIAPVVNGMPHSPEEFNGNIHLSELHAVISRSGANGN